MRYLFVLAILLAWGIMKGQGSGFSFTYTGPTQILVGPDCEAELDWGHPNTPTATSNIPGGFIVSFVIYSISGGYDIGDMIPGGSTVTVFYQATDNFGNSALFGFTIDFVDILPPVFDAFSLPPGNVTVSCITNTPPVADVEATDNCDNDNTDLTITFTETNNAMLCTGGTITRTWVADDGLGNQSTFTQTITVTPDNTPPVIANNLQNGMAPCSTAMAQYSTWLTTQRANFMATDNGCGLLSKTDNAPPPAIITSFCGVIEVTFTATDNCMNVSTVVRTFTVTNNVPPVIVTPASGANGNCSQSNIEQIFNTWINTHGGATATDDCSSIFWSTSPPSPSIHDTCDAAIPVIFIAGDGCGNFDSTSASFVLIDDTPPAITTNPGTIVLSCTAAGIDSILMDWLATGGHSAAHDLCTSDGDLDLGYRISDIELTFEEALDAWEDSLAAGCQDNIIINGIGINNVLSYIEVEFTYTDNCANESGETGVFGITDNGRPQFVTMPVDSSFACSDSANWEDVFLGWYNSAGGSTYMDACSEVTVTANITADSAIQYLTTALDTACLQGVSITLQFTLTDACGNTSTTSPSGTFGLQDTLDPFFVLLAPNIIYPCNENAQMQLQSWLDTLGGAEAMDACGDITWEFSWIDTAGMVQTGVPETGPYPDISTLDCSSGIEIIFTAFDICQNSASDTANFSIIDTVAPVILIAEDSIHLTCQDTVPSIPPSVTDECDDEPLITFTDSVSTDSCLGYPEWIIRTWSATDICGNTSSAQQYYFRLDTIPPVFELPSDTVAFCSIDTLILINVNDNCDPAPVTTWEDILNGPACNQTLTRIWTVSDACGNSATAIQQFDLSDDTPPEIIYSPGDYLFTCDTAALDLQGTYEQWMDSVTIQDGCSNASYFLALRNSYTLEDTSTWPGTPLPDSIIAMCGSIVVIEADLVAYDECGNAIAEPISFSVNDTVPPLFIDCPATIIIDADTSTCDAHVILSSPPILEVCFPDDVKIRLIIDSGDTLSFDSTVTLDTVLAVGIHSVEWIASDCNDNSNSCITSLEVIDENALSVTCPPDTLLFTTEVSCREIVPIYPAETITSSCGLGVITWSGFIEGMANPSAFVFDSAIDTVLVEFAAGLHRVFLVAQDSTGDSDTCFYILELRDTFPPQIICQNGSILLHPSGLENIDVSTASLLVSVEDACGIDTVIYDPPTVNCSNNGQTVAITLTVYDQNGNSSTCESSVIVATQPLTPLWESQLCDDTLRLFANIPDGPDTEYSYSWTGPNSFTSTEENPIIPDADSSFSGIYMLMVSSENGCMSVGMVEILIQELAAPVMTLSADTVCTGTAVLMMTQSYSGDVTYQWFQVVPTGDTLLGTTSEPQFTYVPDQTGTYQVYSVVTQDTCASEPGPPVDFTVVDAPVASIIDPAMILCINDTLYLEPSTIIDSLQYAWSGPSGYQSSEPAPPGIPASEIEAPATYTLIVSNDYCSSIPDSIVVNVQQPPALPIIDGDSLACEGGSISLFTSLDYQSYEWIDPAGNVITSNNDTLLLSPATTIHEGNWQVIGFENGCPSDTSGVFAVQIDTALQIEIQTSQQVCEGESITLTISPAIGGDYVWTGPGGFVSNETSPTTLALNGTYYVAVVTSTGCEATDSIDVSVDVLPVITSLLTDADSCANGIDAVTIWAVTQPGFSNNYTYNWEGPGNFITQDSSIVLHKATSADNGIYTLVIINGTCTSEASTFELLLNDSPASPVISGDVTYCFAEPIILTIESPLAEGLYSWTTPSTTVVIPFPGTLTIPGATPGMSGVYSVEVTVEGCTSLSSSISVQVYGQLTAPSIVTTPLVCEGDSLVLISDAPPGSILHWVGSNGYESMEEQPVIYPVTLADAGFYQVLYILDSCSSPVSNPLDIIVQPIVSAPDVVADLSSVCVGNPVPINLCITPNSTSPGAVYTWLLNGAIILSGPGPDSCITIDSDPFVGGINSISAIATIQGCPSDIGSEVIITGDEIPSQQADAGFDDEFCPGESIVLDGSDPSPGTGIWTSQDDLVVFSDEFDPNTEVLGLPSGDYVLTWTLSYASCQNYSADSVVITILSSPETFPDTVDVPFGQTVEFIVVTNDNISMGPYTLEIVLDPEHGNALHAGNGIFRYTPNIGFVGTDMFIYRICSQDCPEECSEAVVILRVGNEDDCFVPTLFTPNDDGINDVLIVPCLETDRFPTNEIIIFNEWGDAVFKASPYLNDWDGTVSGDPLPVGTYFYIMDFGNGTEPKRSFLVLEK